MPFDGLCIRCQVYVLSMQKMSKFRLFRQSYTLSRPFWLRKSEFKPKSVISDHQISLVYHWLMKLNFFLTIPPPPISTTLLFDFWSCLVSVYNKKKMKWIWFLQIETSCTVPKIGGNGINRATIWKMEEVSQKWGCNFVEFFLPR